MICAWMTLHVIGVAAQQVIVRPPEIVFPRDPQAVIDAKRDLGARGDGKHDDTEALQRGIDLSCGVGGNTRVLYLPNGVYRITRPLIVKTGIGPWIYGQSRDGVVIRLDDGVNVEAAIRTHPSATEPRSADWFMRTLCNLTVDVGNNPETDGVRFFSNNTGLLKWVRVRGRGKVGINSFMQLNGPNLIQDVVVDGFETGILSQWMWGQTLSRVVIRNCRRTGLEVRANAVAAEDLVIENTPTPVVNDIPNEWYWWGGVLAIVGGRIEGRGGEAAIVNSSVLYVRSLRTRGYRLAIQSSTPSGNVASPEVTEYISHEVKRLFEQARPTTLRLPVKREPVLWERNPSQWVCANDFGAVPGDNVDDTQAIQRAIDAAAQQGKTVVYLRGIGGTDPNWYTLQGEVRVHGSVRHIIGLGFGRIIAGENGRFIVDEHSAPVVKFENIQAFGGRPPVVENRSRTRTLVLESCDLKVVGNGRGDIFMTNCPSHIDLRQRGQSLWARQLNPEGTDDIGLVRNAGANLWVLGMKCEGAGVRVRTERGGKTEILGTFIYGPGVPASDTRPLFDIDNASVCLMGVREIAFGETYAVKARERRGSDQREFRLQPGEHGWIGWALYSGW
ncbi:MAG: glycosyl hydrolase family 28-related protein [Armatimonadota bacterium]|nr:glycosyl hydrolase family 28-related protein [Armatimonadota bacterium]